MKRTLGTLGWLLALSAGVAYARTLFGADVGQPCSEFILSCRATRGTFTINGCVRTGPSDDDTYCSYACESDAACPEDWSCDSAASWSSVPGSVDGATRVCRRPD